MAKKYNKSRKQKPNYSRRKNERFQEEFGKDVDIAEEIPINTGNKTVGRRPGSDYFR